MNQKVNRKEFWMLIVDEEKVPTQKHYNLEEVVQEAERLAKLTVKDVFLLKAIKFVRYTPPVSTPTIEWKKTVESW